MTIEVLLTEQIFRQFTIFNILRLRKMWRAPITFAAILGTSATISFIMRHVDGAVFLGCVLLLVGLGVPVVYFVTFFSSLRKEVLKHGLKRPHLVYTLTLTPQAKGIHIQNETEQVDYQWKHVWRVFRDKEATYLYMTPDRAFILPHQCIEEGEDALWHLIRQKIDPSRCTILK